MPSFLLFTLYSPLASFGEIAVGEERRSWARPGKSAVLGLVGAALGLCRSDPVWQSMDVGYHYAVRTDRSGVPLTDYHTVQSAPTARGKPFRTRREVLEAKNVGTVVTRRGYLADAISTVLIHARENAPFPLDAIADALRSPKFTLYLGRKSCPLALPPAPRMVEAEDLAGAFELYDRCRPEPELVLIRSLIGTRSSVTIAADVDMEKWLAGLRTERRELRRDAIAHRSRWQFALRDEIIAVYERSGG